MGYIDDIQKGKIETIEYDEYKDLFNLTIVGKNAKEYIVCCDAWRKEIYTSTSSRIYDDYELPQDAMYDYNVTILSVSDTNEYGDPLVINSQINFDELTEWLENNLDWDEIDYIREDNDSSDLEHYDEEGDDYGM